MTEGWKKFYARGRYHYVRAGFALCGVPERGDQPFLERDAAEKPKWTAACSTCFRLYKREQTNGR